MNKLLFNQSPNKQNVVHLLIMKELSGKNRNNIEIGDWVAIVQKHHQKSGEETEGEVKRILTKSSTHPHGIKVMLSTGEVGRVTVVFSDED